MNLARFWIENRVVTLVLTAVILAAGVSSFNGMSRLEDPEFTIKDALVVTPYAGASAYEVEEEVTDELETAIQQLGQLKELESKSDRGLSTITVTVKDQYDKSSLPQVWDELRRKVGDAQSSLPPGAGPSIVVDDFGDVYGVFVAISGPEYEYAELKRVTDFMRRELLLVQDVAKIVTFGERQEAIYVELNRDRVAQLGLQPDAIVRALQDKNIASDAGRMKVGSEYITIEPTGLIRSVEDFEDLLITAGSAQQVRLRDVATVRRGYVDPPGSLLRYDGRVAIGLGISTVPGGNVVTMGAALSERFQELLGEVPLGIEVGIISLQSQAVTLAIRSFTSSLIQAVVIVVIVLLFFMGLRAGVIIGFVLVMTIAGSFIFLQPWGVALERISLGALIIALGMLVDNAIVVVDGVLVRLARGEEPQPAAEAVVSQNATPLLGATVIAILAFAAIGTSPDKTGEFCRSLFQVVLISLLFSWITAVTVTPLLCVMFLKQPEPGAGDAPEEDPEAGFYGRYKGLLRSLIRMRWLTVGAVVAIFFVSLRGFGYVEQSFFPPSTRPQFLVDLWMPKGTHIDDTTARVEEVEKIVREFEGVTHVTSFIAKGGLRFLLTYSPEKQNSAYAQILIDVDEAERIDGLQGQIETALAERFPGMLSYAFKFELGPGSNGKVRARLSGPDPNVLRRLASEVTAILAADPNTKALRTDWQERVKLLRPQLAEEEADANGITRRDVAEALLTGSEGRRVSVFRDDDLLLPVIVRNQDRFRGDVADLRNLQIWSPAANGSIPLRQVVSDFETGFEDSVVWRRDRKRTITVFADPKEGPASVLFGRVRPQIEAIELPTGYTLEWGGEYEDSANARGPLLAALPAFLLMMFLITVILFNSLRQPFVIWANVPLALIGVTVGLLATGQPFGFMALLGFLSLMGMLIKNAIVLVDEINLQLSEGKAPLDAIVDSGASRLRPVAMAALTTALGMIPLLLDAFFISMAVTIIFGLMFATVLTMVVLPVVYAIVFSVESDA